ncbi:MAG TPA: hypothetical protein VFG19_12180 [Geobacteraceae bacterium]|nr:hypothetical protein [Geobacteraceae bacterium]
MELFLGNFFVSVIRYNTVRGKSIAADSFDRNAPRYETKTRKKFETLISDRSRARIIRNTRQKKQERRSGRAEIQSTASEFRGCRAKIKAEIKADSSFLSASPAISSDRK